MFKKFNTTEELLKLAREMVLKDQCGIKYDEVVVRCFFDELKYRQKRNTRKRSANNYQAWLYYIAYDGRLARVPNTAKNPIGSRLLRKKTIKPDEWGLLRCEEIIDEGQFVKIRPLLKELDHGDKWDEDIKERIARYLDGGKQCKMIIDRQFDVAYENEYHDDFCLEGDLVTGESCMSTESDCAQEFYGGINGCYVCRFENDEGEQVGRCLMYEYNGVRHFIRIYAYRDYARCALRLLRAEMKEGDLFGRSECIDNMRLTTEWDGEETHTMYLDGRYYGVNLSDMTVGVNYTLDLKTTGNESLNDYFDECGYTKCCVCGEWEEKDDGLWIEDDFYCSESCAMEDNCVKCEYCGEWSKSDCDGFYTPEGEYYCSRSCLSNADYVICQECGEIHYYEDAVEICGDWFCNEDCAREHGLVKCSVCGDWYRGLYKNMNTGAVLCGSCAEKQGLQLAYVTEKQFNRTNKKEVNND